MSLLVDICGNIRRAGSKTHTILWFHNPYQNFVGAL